MVLIETKGMILKKTNNYILTVSTITVSCIKSLNTGKPVVAKHVTYMIIVLEHI